MPKEERKTFNNQKNEEWKNWMKSRNQWISFYEWYYPSSNQIEESLRKSFLNQARQKRIQDVDNFVADKMESNPVTIPSPLVIPEFSPKIQNMLSKPNLPRDLQAIRTKGE